MQSWFSKKGCSAGSARHQAEPAEKSTKARRHEDKKAPNTMRVTILGYGKMGKMVEEVCRDQGHEVLHTIDIENLPSKAGFSGEWVQKTDVLIDFSVAAAVVTHVENAARAGIPLVIGTTGWSKDLEKVGQIVETQSGACVYSSNFSMGVQALFYLTRQAGKLISGFQDFHPFIEESHHIQKVDAPSGTALTLSNILRESYDSEIPISSLRAGFFPGNHVVGFDSPFDTLRLEHRARSREGFAQGALFAAQWIQGKSGLYRFEEVLFGEEQ
ncbi:MAG: dihydrodipicolinate reductase [Acidobacteria bacterium]|nr:MAG: dihydrodipicolinate reductase [Acidobacteriota bacterium]